MVTKNTEKDIKKRIEKKVKIAHKRLNAFYGAQIDENEPRSFYEGSGLSFKPPKNWRKI